VSFTVEQAEARLRAFGHERWKHITEICHEGKADGIGPVEIFAISLRETGCKNIVGDGGHGRGWTQIDDRFHAPWLRAHAGCKSGSWEPTKHHALEPGYCPSLTASTLYTIVLLRGNRQFLIANGVPSGHAAQAAIAAFNCGAGGALAAYRSGHIDIRTTGRNYSADVLKNEAAVRAALKRLRWSQ
jgi:hypothetical protein